MLKYAVSNFISLDRNTRTILHEQVFHQLREAILAGGVSRGARLPPTRTLAQELGVSRNTVNLAYERLSSEGYLVKRQGSGTYVATDLPEDNHPPPAKLAKSDHTAAQPSRRAQMALTRNDSWNRRDRYDLSPGLPALDCFPHSIFARLAGQTWRRRMLSNLGYGNETGLQSLRERLAQYLGEARGLACDPQQIIVVASTLQAVNLVAHTLLDPGDKVAVEDPGHAQAIATLRTAGQEVLPVPLDACGMRLDVLRQAVGVRLVMLSPVNQYPTGATMSAAHGEALMEWARANDVWVMEDDFNSELRWAGKALAPLAARTKVANVIHASSFNRVLAPGIRLAYLVVPPDLVDAFSAMQETLACHAPSTQQDLIAEFMAEGQLAAHIRRMRPIYRERAEVLTAALKAEFDGVFVVPDVEAGLHVTITTRNGQDDKPLADKLRSVWIDAPALSQYCSARTDLNGLVLGFGATQAHRFGPIVKRMAHATRSLLAP